MNRLFRFAGYFSGSVLLAFCIACGSGTNPNPPADLKTHPAAAPEVNVKAAVSLQNRVDKAVETGGVRVTVKSIAVESVPLTDIGGDTNQSADELLTITLTIENLSDSKKIEYAGWGSKLFIERTPATLVDELDNSYKRIHFGFGTKVEGQHQLGMSIYPGKSETEVLVFQTPIEKAEFLILALPMEALGIDGRAELVVRNPLRVDPNAAPAALVEPEPEQVPEPAPKPDAAKERYEMRVWTSTKGKTLKAIFVSADEGWIRLLKEDGNLLAVEKAKLSEADQKYIDDLGRR